MLEYEPGEPRIGSTREASSGGREVFTGREWVPFNPVAFLDHSPRTECTEAQLVQILGDILEEKLKPLDALIAKLDARLDGMEDDEMLKRLRPKIRQLIDDQIVEIRRSGGFLG